MDLIVNNLGIIIYATLLFTPPLLFAAMGSCFSELSGVVNIGIEGMMTIGAFVGAATGHYTGNPWLSFICGGLAGMLFGALHALATVKLNADQTISGTAINFLAPGVAVLMAKALFNSSDTAPLDSTSKIPTLFADAFTGGGVWNNFMKNVFSTYATTYLVFIVLVIVWFVFYKTRYGLRLRACGEHPETCDTLGINVIRMRFSAVCISGFLAGLGGACVTMATMNQFRPTSIVGQGFIAIAAVIFGKFRPQGAMIACLLFGMCSGIRVVVGSNAMVSAQLISMIPYVVTVVVLILFVGKAHVPSANGKPYVKAK
ncbi:MULTISPECIES: ABC transporter permease [Eubacteriales]|uniref:ABC transporter permease n=1 Tax=Eubacteriales TaxID=186802 RepID=UPI000B3AC0F8|nr:MULTISPECIES: ABC transporter permease [Eubacteriales]MDY4166699.1 ABC transporter permease [Fournierella sp.]OUP24334.1 sugar ABC transporter permease [Gemmiger sp. An194]